MDHGNYRFSNTWNPSRFLPYNDIKFDKGFTYAYGYLANPFKTNVLVLDFDSVDINTVLETFPKLGWVNEIDVAVSSRDAFTLEPLRYHLYFGLNSYYNVLPIYKLDIPGACLSYNNCVLTKQEMIIRASKKFKNDKKDIDTNIIWHEGYSRKDKDTWLKYSLEQLIAPLTTADGPLLSTTQLRTRPVLKLRG